MPNAQLPAMRLSCLILLYKMRMPCLENREQGGGGDRWDGLVQVGARSIILLVAGRSVIVEKPYEHTERGYLHAVEHEPGNSAS
jgi:hypothetical protein